MVKGCGHWPKERSPGSGPPKPNGGGGGLPPLGSSMPSLSVCGQQSRRCLPPSLPSVAARLAFGAPPRRLLAYSNSPYRARLCGGGVLHKQRTT